MHFTDAVTVAGTRKRSDGYLVVDARLARTGLQKYLGSEVGKPDQAIVTVYRSADEVFHKDSMASFAHRPVTNDHPADAVTADNWKTHAVGSTSDEIKRDGDFVRVPLMVSDAATIRAVESGKRELSAGYTCELKWEPGVTADGQTYDAIQTNIRANHVAIVTAGRAGKDCRIGDAAVDHWGAAPITRAQDKETPMNLRTVMVDGLSVETTDQGAQAIERLTSDKKTLQSALDAEKSKTEEERRKHEAEMAKKDAALDDAKAKVLDQAGIDRLVSDRVALVAVAAKIAPNVKTTGLSDAALRLEVVKTKLGDAAVAGKSEAYVDARFDILAEDAAAKADPVRHTMTSMDRAAPGRVMDSRGVINHDAAMADREAAFQGLLHFDATGQELEA